MGNVVHFLKRLMRISSSKNPPRFHDEIKPRAFNHVTNSRFTSVLSILGVPHPGLMSEKGSANE